MLTATTWVPRGFPATKPTFHVPDEEEMALLDMMAKAQIAEEQDEESSEEEDKVKPADSLRNTEDIDADLAEYNLEDYDKEEDATGQIMGMFGNAKSLQYHENDGGDAYVTLAEGEEEDEFEQDKEDWMIKPTDNMILAARTDDNLSQLVVYTYNDDPNEDDPRYSENDIYPHHDFLLPSMPLSVEWLDYKAGTDDPTPGNFCAVSTFLPQIEIWNLDVVHGIFPSMTLGAPEENDPEDQVKKGKKKKHNKKINEKHHTAAVLSLSSNRLHRNLLASGSADSTIKVWNLTNGECVKSLNFHESEVSSVAWNPKDGSVLLSGGFDKKVVVADVQAAEDDGVRTWAVDSSVETVKWGNNGQFFYVSTSSGRIYKFDFNIKNKSVWTLQAHDGEVSSFDVNEFIDGLIVSGSQNDQTVKLWNATDNKPSLIVSRNLGVGKVFSTKFAPDAEIAGHVTVGGTEGSIKVWDTMTNRFVRESVGKQMAKLAASRAERPETIAQAPEEDDDSEDEDNEEEAAYEDIDDDEDEEDE